MRHTMMVVRAASEEQMTATPTSSSVRRCTGRRSTCILWIPMELACGDGSFLSFHRQKHCKAFIWRVSSSRGKVKEHQAPALGSIVYIHSGRAREEHGVRIR